MMNGSSAISDSDTMAEIPSRPFNWSMAAQARHIVAMDVRIIGIDAVYGIFYVLVSFFVFLRSNHNITLATLMPFLALSGVVFYYAVRISYPDAESKTAMFYANLPREPMLTYWARAVALAAFTLAMEGLIALANLLHFGISSGGTPRLVAPYMPFLPFLAIAFAFWSIYGRANWYIRMPVWVALISGIFCLVLWDSTRYDEGITHPIWQSYGQPLAIALVAAFLLWHGHHCWKKTQVGEIS